MGMPAVRTDWTVDELDALEDDGQRYELIDGELFVTPAPRDVHQLVVVELLVRLDSCLTDRSLARAVVSPSDVRRGDYTQNRVQPDVFVLRLIDGKRPPYPYAVSDLALVIEVLSPGSRRLDLVIKRDLYLREGVGEYWVVDPAQRSITRWRSLDKPSDILTETIEWQLDGMPAAWTCQIPEMFRRALE
jgi:Uma2 family endonuclease